MDSSTVTYLNSLNREFYRITAPHFNATRQQAWAGWQQVLPYLQSPIRVLDIACGNGRFAQFLQQSLHSIDIDYTGIDSDPTLLAYANDALHPLGIKFQLLEQDILQTPLPNATYDLVVLFGLMHHIPSWQNRRQFLSDAAQCVADGGLLIFACWRFLDVESLKKRLVDWPAEHDREANDYLLDWRRGEHALRYCHYVDDDEHKRLIEATGLGHVLTFRADGRNNALNQYSILRR